MFFNTFAFVCFDLNILIKTKQVTSRAIVQIFLILFTIFLFTCILPIGKTDKTIRILCMECSFSYSTTFPTYQLDY